MRSSWNKFLDNLGIIVAAAAVLLIVGWALHKAVNSPDMNLTSTVVLMLAIALTILTGWWGYYGENNNLRTSTASLAIICAVAFVWRVDDDLSTNQRIAAYAAAVLVPLGVAMFFNSIYSSKPSK